MDMWQRNAKWLLGLLPQRFFGRLLILMRSFMESCWISLTSQEIRVENTNALQTTLVEVIHQRCSLMCSVRTNALHHHLLFVLTRLNEVCCLMFFSLIHVLIESSSHNYWCFSCTNKCSGWFVSETIHFLFLIYSLFSKIQFFSFGTFQEHDTFWIGKILINEIEWQPDDGFPRKWILFSWQFS